jgi:hypothetical protein
MYTSIAKFKMDKTYKKMDNIITTTTPIRSELQAFMSPFLNRPIKLNQYNLTALQRPASTEKGRAAALTK